MSAAPVLIDTNVLIHLLDRRTSGNRKARLDGLVADIEQGRGQLLIPAQVVAEYLVHAGNAGPALLERWLAARFIKVLAYDHVIAVENAEMERVAHEKGDKRWPLPRDAVWQKVKVDRQIVAAAKVHKALVVAEDKQVRALGAAAGLKVKAINDLPIPESAKQLTIEGVTAPVVPFPRRGPAAR